MGWRREGLSALLRRADWRGNVRASLPGEGARNRFVMGAIPALLLGLLVVGSGLGAAQGGPPAATERSPLVGSWWFTGTDPLLFTFHADGTVVATDEHGQTYHGAWAAIEAATVTFALETLLPSRGTMGQGFQDVIDIGDDPDEIPYGDGVLRRIVASELGVAVATPASSTNP